MIYDKLLKRKKELNSFKIHDDSVSNENTELPRKRRMKEIKFRSITLKDWIVQAGKEGFTNLSGVRFIQTHK